MAEKEETITVAVRLPMSDVTHLRQVVQHDELRNMSELLRRIVTEWIQNNA